MPEGVRTAIDLDPTGNTCSGVGATGGGFDAGDIQSTATSPLNVPFDTNILVEGVPVGPAPDDGTGGLYGVGFEFNYNPAIIRVTASSGGANNVLHMCSGSGYVAFEPLEGTPDTDGSYRFDSVDLSGNEESGSGRIGRIQIECIAVGQSDLTLTDTSTGGGSTAGILGDSGAITYTVVQEFEAVVNCVPGATFGAVAVAGARQGPAAQQPGRLPTAGGDPASGNSTASLLAVVGVFLLIAGSAAFSWSASRKQQ